MTLNARSPGEWTPGLVRRLTRLAQQNMSASQIADTLGLSRGQVLGKMRRLGLSLGSGTPAKRPPRRVAKRPPDFDATRLADLAGRGLSAKQIGGALGLSRHQVMYRVRKLGLKLQPNTGWPQGATEMLAALADQGLSNGGIAKAMGLTRGQVLGKMYRLGLKTVNATTVSTAGRSRTATPMDAAL